MNSLAMHRARAVVWAQWRTYRNFGPKGGAWLSYILGTVWYGAWLFAGLAAGQLMARPEAADLTVQIAGVLLLMSLYWQLIPMMMAASGMSLDLNKLKVYPIPVAQLFTIEVLLRITAALEMFLILIGATFGLLFNPALSGWRTLGVIPFAAFHLLLALGLRDAIVRLLGTRRIREIAALTFVALITVPRFVFGRRNGGGAWIARQFSGTETGETTFWLPWVAAAHVFTGQDPWTSAAVISGWCALAGMFALWQFQRTLRFDPDAAQSAGNAPKDRRTGILERFYQWPSSLLGDPLAILLEKENRYMLRAARFRMLFLISCAIGLAMAQVFSRQGMFSFGPSFLTAAGGYTLLMLGEVCIWNIFGFDRTAAQMYFVAPVPFSRVLLAKNLAAGMWIAIAQATTTLLCLAFGFPVTLSLVAETAAVTTVVALFLISAGNYVSVSAARPTDPAASTRSRSAGGVQVLVIFLYPVLFIPPALAYFARWAFDSQLAFYGILAVMAGIGGTVYYFALDVSTELAEQKKESMLTALSASHGPISS